MRFCERPDLRVTVCVRVERECAGVADTTNFRIEQCIEHHLRGKGTGTAAPAAPTCTSDVGHVTIPLSTPHFTQVEGTLYVDGVPSAMQ